MVIAIYANTRIAQSLSKRPHGEHICGRKTYKQFTLENLYAKTDILKTVINIAANVSTTAAVKHIPKHFHGWTVIRQWPRCFHMQF